MARRKKKTRASKKNTPSGRRGGRKPGRWELLNPEELLEFRKQRGLSRAKLADQLGVSTTSIQNWETGRAASMKIQRKLRDLIDGKAAPVTEAAVSTPTAASNAIETTGNIVAAYLANQKAAMQPAQLAKLVRSIRVALT